MIKKTIFLSIASFIYIAHICAQTPQNGKLEVNISEFRNMKGHLLISLFNSSEHFPRNEKEAFRIKKVKVTQSSHKIIFEDLPFGEYAVIFLHDENGNEDMDTNIMGIPQEGYGASNNAVNTFSAPKYDEAKFIVDSQQTEQNLKIYY